MSLPPKEADRYVDRSTDMQPLDKTNPIVDSPTPPLQEAEHRSEAPEPMMALPEGVPNPSTVGNLAVPAPLTMASTSEEKETPSLMKVDPEDEKAALGLRTSKETQSDDTLTQVGEKPKSKKRRWFGKKSKDETTVDASSDKNDGEGKEKAPTVSLFALYKYHTKLEIILNICGLVMAIAAGATQPLMTLIFGRLTTSFTDFTRTLLETNGDTSSPAFQAVKERVLRDSANNASYLVYIGLGMFVCTYLYMVIWQITAERASKRIRERFVKAILNQEISFFDNLGSGEVATRIESDTHLVHTGLGEKVPTSVQYVATFFTGFILAFGKRSPCL